jgi:hypothetical protein
LWSLHADAPVAPGSLGRATEEATSGSGTGGAGAAGAAAPAPAPAAPLAPYVPPRQGKISGGVLADDMGLGKTAQCIAFVSGCLHSEKAASVLVILPLSLLATWQAEFARFAPGVIVRTLHEQNGIRARAKVVASVLRDGGVLLTT